MNAVDLQHSSAFVLISLDCESGASEDLENWLDIPGWLAVCPDHGTILLERCGACGASLRVAPFATEASFSPAACTRCGENLLGGKHLSAYASARRMQAALLRGKCEGVSELDGLGKFRWPEMITLADVLVGMVWTDLTLAEQEQIFRFYGGLATAGTGQMASMTVGMEACISWRG